MAAARSEPGPDLLIKETHAMELLIKVRPWGVLMPWFFPSSLPFPDALLSLTQAHTQHRHGTVAQAVFFLMVMGFPHHLQIVILKASTILSTVDCLHLLCKYLIDMDSVYSGLFAPFVQIPDCIWMEWMDGWIAGSTMHHLDWIRSGVAAAAPSFHGGHPRHDPHKELQADKVSCMTDTPGKMMLPHA